MNRGLRIILAVLFMIVVGGSISWFVTHREKPQDLTIQVQNTGIGTPVKIYAAASDDDTNPSSFINDKNLTATAQQSTKLTLKKGKYVVVSTNSPDYDQQVSVVTLGDKPESVVINPIYSQKKLADLLVKDAAIIKQTITKSLSPSIAGFEVRPGKLYENGEWYATTIIPKLSEEERRLNYTDTYRIVLHKTTNSWVIVTLPELVLSHQKYPDIPKGVLVDVNKQ